MTDHASPATETEIREALARRPGDPDMLLRLASAAMRRGDPAVALAALADAAALRPDHARTQIALANAHIIAGAHRRALPHAEAATRLDPGNAQSWATLGFLNRALLRYVPALGALEESLRLDPTLADARLALAATLFESGCWVQAAEQAEALLATQPGDERARMIAGLARLRARHPAAVLAHFGRAFAGSGEDAVRAAACAEAALLSGDRDAALGHLAAAGDLLSHPATAVAAGRIAEACGDLPTALARYDAALALQDNDTAAFTAHALARAKLHANVQAGDAAQPPVHPDRWVTAGTVGTIGRFGDQLGQYALARLYADSCGLRLMTLPWIGQPLFGIRDAAMAAVPPAHYVRVPPDDPVYAAIARWAPLEPAPVLGRDIVGPFVPLRLAAQRDRVRQMFRLVAPWSAMADAARSRLLARGRTIVAVHLRFGDFLRDRASDVVDPRAYAAWLEGIWPGLDRPVLYVATDEPARALPMLRPFGPVTAADVAGGPQPLPFLLDFAMLAAADALAVARSHFSRWAALLNVRARLLAKPAPGNAALMSFDPWTEDGPP
ncbi:MAG: hypothetical protein JNK11_11435 [Alphaproteobacteria bacterium]|nr:hypothetical protein [Alphaproteobacteria bacterium]